MLKHKTFSASSEAELDTAVNAFVGRQTSDSRTISREIKQYNFFVSGGVFYAAIVYDDKDL